MKTVKYDVTYKEEASRVELFIRWFWSIPCFIVLLVLSIIFCIAAFFQFWYVLFLGKRQQMLHDLMFKYAAYSTKWMTYMYLTDERCPIMPED